ncbi:MAG: type II toxin-antitoxin system RelE/ParE family toxin [Deltaproteobacteria bacterium]|nr:MAG: type II toxin-antitoxin system RelE/ParE family toxin [Deltaproteobacteria bacterium]
MSYDVKLMPQAQKDLVGLRGKLLTRFEDLILGLYDEPRPHNSRKLSGGGSRWRIRTGDYRILYEIDEPRKVVKIYRIAHRKEVYR